AGSGRNFAIAKLAGARLLEEDGRSAGEIVESHEQQSGYETLRLKLAPHATIDGGLKRRRAVQNRLAGPTAGELLGIDFDDDRNVRDVHVRFHLEQNVLDRSDLDPPKLHRGSDAEAVNGAGEVEHKLGGPAEVATGAEQDHGRHAQED